MILSVLLVTSADYAVCSEELRVEMTLEYSWFRKERVVEIGVLSLCYTNRFIIRCPHFVQCDVKKNSMYMLQ